MSGGTLVYRILVMLSQNHVLSPFKAIWEDMP